MLFPELEKFTQDESIMKENKEQHHKFFVGLEDFDSYMRELAPTAYNWEDVKSKLDAFAEDLVEHLRNEIPTLLSLKKYERDGIKAAWKKLEDAAKGDIRLPNMFVSCICKTSNNAQKSNQRNSGYNSADGSRMLR